MMMINNHDSDNGITYTMGDDTNGTEHLNALVSLVTIECDIMMMSSITTY